uniref:Uncharacterized protein n=1 Tax=Arundo donax TaxID=35708 RepID=A0A0A8Y3E4_ARUDO
MGCVLDEIMQDLATSLCLVV